MTINQDGLWVQPGQGASFSVVGDLVTFKAVGEDTDGKYALFEIVVQPLLMKHVFKPERSFLRYR